MSETRADPAKDSHYWLDRASEAYESADPRRRQECIQLALDHANAASEVSHVISTVLPMIEQLATSDPQEEVDFEKNLEARVHSATSRLGRSIADYLGIRHLETLIRERDVQRQLHEVELYHAKRLRGLRRSASAEIKDAYDRASLTAKILSRQHDNPNFPSPNELGVGSLDVAEFIRIGALVAPGDVYDIDQLYRKIPAIVPLLNHGNIVVVSESSHESLEHILRMIVLRSLVQTGPGELSIDTWDPLLKSIMGPFAPLRKGGEFLFPERASTTEELEALSRRLMGDVKRISDLFHGRRISLSDLKQEHKDITEAYRLVVLLDFPARVSQAAIERLEVLLEAAPRCGTSFLVHYDPSLTVPNWLDPARLLSHATLIESSGSEFMIQKSLGLQLKIDTTPRIQEITTAAEAVATAAENAVAPLLDFMELITHEEMWKMKSDDGIAAVFGRVGGERLSVTLGSELGQRHNILVSGAVGQGKSVLLMALIHSIAWMYGPDEVEMYLIDLKEGLTLQPLAPDGSETPSFLPHARVLGLDSNVAFATSVLEHLVYEFEDRAVIMRDYGDNIMRYRSARPDAKMPRVILMIDEFHKLFAADEKWSKRALEALVRLAREGRAYGIHLILASQTLSGITAILAQQDGIFAQFPIRLALKNSESESRVVLSRDNSEAARLRYRGEIIVNEDFGMADANRRGIVADASNKEAMASVRMRLCERAAMTPNMRVFDGSEPVHLGDYIQELNDLRNRSNEDISERYGIVASALSVEKAFAGVRMEPRGGSHIAVLGHGSTASARPGIRHQDLLITSTGRNLALGALLSATIALALQHPRRDARFIVLDFLQPHERSIVHLDRLIRLMKALDFDIRILDRFDSIRFLTDVQRTLRGRSSTDDVLYVIGLGLDRADLDDTPLECSDEGSDELKGTEFAMNRISPVDGLRSILKSGSAGNISLLGWWTLVSQFDQHLGFGGRGHISGTLVLGVEQTDVYGLVGRHLEWNFGGNRGLLHQAGLGEPEIVMPFAPPSPDDYDSIIDYFGVSHDK